MAEKRGSKKYIEEHEDIIEIHDSDMGLTFFSGSSPPRIQKIGIFSYFFGWLFPGDWILQIDNRAINSAEDFTAATQHSGAQPKRLFIRFRRDDYFRMINLKVTQVRKRPSHKIIVLQIRWREDLPIGISVERKAIRQSIAEKKNVVLKLERDGSSLKLISTPAEDVVEILTRAKGFWNKRCRLIPIEEEEPRKPKRGFLERVRVFG
uniref:Uncharacterized protein n=1 Tax=Meloidogyne enterolobii TaxID=390850 RepID=A0A6V7X589_MELEN|nr:unnamed protein product [Meloidogyne enterolobii]